MNRAPTVAVVRSDNRRGAVAEALALVADDLRARVAPEVLIQVDSAGRRPLASTHPDTLSAALDAVLAAGAGRAVVAGGGADFDRPGYRKETAGRPVDYRDLDRDESAWDPLELVDVDGSPISARVARSVAAAPCLVSLSAMKTHGASTVAFGIRNLLNCLHPEDRARVGGGAGRLDRDGLVARLGARASGRARRLKLAITGRGGPDGWGRLGPAEVGFLRAVEATDRNLVALARVARPRLSVVDGFVAMHREGPRHGSPIRLRAVVAGVDAVAVDAVAAAVMGFDPMGVGHLRLAQAAGLGVADLGAIRLVGDPLDSVARRCVPHSNQAIVRHWDRLPGLPPAPRRESAVPAPHARPARASESARRG